MFEQQVPCRHWTWPRQGMRAVIIASWPPLSSLPCFPPQNLLPNGLLNPTPVTGLIGSIADNLDTCVKEWVNLNNTDPRANQVSIAAVGTDGLDRVYTVAVNEVTRFAGFMSIYRTNTDGTQVGSSLGVAPLTLCTSHTPQLGGRILELSHVQYTTAAKWQ